MRLDLSGTKLDGKTLSKWKTGGLVNEVKPRKELAFRSLEEALTVPANEGLAAFFGPQHPDQGAWEQGAGKMLHNLYVAALQFQEEKGHFPRLHDEDDSRALKGMFDAVNKAHGESGKDMACVVENADMKRLNAYSWYFQTELSGYCAFLGGVAAQEVVKKFSFFVSL